MFFRDIEDMGLTEKEAKLYFTSLRLGPASMQVLARKAKIDRGTAYHVAMTLEGKGLFRMAVDGKRPLFGVTHPRNLYHYVEVQKREAEERYAVAQTMLADLEALYSTQFGLEP